MVSACFLLPAFSSPATASRFLETENIPNLSSWFSLPCTSQPFLTLIPSALFTQFYIWHLLLYMILLSQPFLHQHCSVLFCFPLIFDNEHLQLFLGLLRSSLVYLCFCLPARFLRSPFPPKACMLSGGRMLAWNFHYYFEMHFAILLVCLSHMTTHFQRNFLIPTNACSLFDLLPCRNACWESQSYLPLYFYHQIIELIIQLPNCWVSITHAFSRSSSFLHYSALFSVPGQGFTISVLSGFGASDPLLWVSLHYACCLSGFLLCHLEVFLLTLYLIFTTAFPQSKYFFFKNFLYQISQPAWETRASCLYAPGFSWFSFRQTATTCFPRQWKGCPLPADRTRSSHSHRYTSWSRSLAFFQCFFHVFTPL